MPKRRPSSIDRLPDETRESVHRRLAAGRDTQLEIVADLNAEGHAVSKSALNRYAKNFRKLGERLRLAREAATALGRSLEDAPETDVGRLLIEGIEAEVLSLFLELTDAGVDERSIEDSVELLETISRTVRDLGTAKKSRIDGELKIRDRIIKKAAAAIAEVGTQQGLAAETVAAFKAKLLGLTQVST